jgi:hypothetical protein
MLNARLTGDGNAGRASSGPMPWGHGMTVSGARRPIIVRRNAAHLRPDDGKLAPENVKTVWRGILQSTLKGDDMKKLGPDD